MNRLGRILTATEKTYEKTRLHAGNTMKALRAQELYASGIIPDEVAKYGSKSLSQLTHTKTIRLPRTRGAYEKNRGDNSRRVALIE